MWNDIVNSVLGILPDSPFLFLRNLDGSAVSSLLGMVNWFVPIYSFVAILEGWLVCIAVWYLYQAVLRWARAIE